MKFAWNLPIFLLQIKAWLARANTDIQVFWAQGLKKNKNV